LGLLLSGFNKKDSIITEAIEYLQNNQAEYDSWINRAKVAIVMLLASDVSNSLPDIRIIREDTIKTKQVDYLNIRRWW